MFVVQAQNLGIPMKQILPDVIGFNLYMMDCMQLILAETNYIDPVRVEIYEIVMTENFPKLMTDSLQNPSASRQESISLQTAITQMFKITFTKCSKHTCAHTHIYSSGSNSNMQRAWESSFPYSQ